MASGFGYGGGRSRCFTFWQEFQKCYANADQAVDCIAQKDDYMECLHHTKEIERMKTIKDHFVARQAHEAKKAREQGEVRATSSIMRLGIIGAKDGGDDSDSSSSSKSSSSSQPPSNSSSEEKDGKGQNGVNDDKGVKGNQAEKKSAQSN